MEVWTLQQARACNDSNAWHIDIYALGSGVIGGTTRLLWDMAYILYLDTTQNALPLAKRRHTTVTDETWGYDVRVWEFTNISSLGQT